jgi:hypothetical protein
MAERQPVLGLAPAHNASSPLLQGPDRVANGFACILILARLDRAFDKGFLLWRQTVIGSRHIRILAESRAEPPVAKFANFPKTGFGDGAPPRPSRS